VPNGKSVAWDKARFDTLYFGGGTPSSLKPERLERIIEGLKSILPMGNGPQLFLEANPEDIDDRKLSRWKEMGFSMISLGVQSFNARILRTLGRGHSSDQARWAVKRVRDEGFETVSVDLIFGIEGQREEEWTKDLVQAVELGVDHISCYQLTIEAGSLFGRRSMKGARLEMGEEEQAKMYLLTHRVLSDRGFEGYEVSNFAREGHRSAHNIKYWNGSPYLGLGPGAHSFDGSRHRWWNRSRLRLWAASVREGLLPRESEDCDLLERNRRQLEELETSGFLQLAGNRVLPTPRGMAVADALARDLIMDDCSD